MKPGTSSTTRRIVFGVLLGLGVLLAIGWGRDGIDRWDNTHGSGTLGTLRLERIVTKSVGKPPPIKQWGGTFTSDDGRVARFVVLGEPLPGGDSTGFPGMAVRVRQSSAQNDEVFLASGSRAFTNWVEGGVFAVVLFGVLGGIVVWRRARKRRAQGDP